MGQMSSDSESYALGLDKPLSTQAIASYKTVSIEVSEI
jgi:hypothetical protein